MSTSIHLSCSERAGRVREAVRVSAVAPFMLESEYVSRLTIDGHPRAEGSR